MSASPNWPVCSVPLAEVTDGLPSGSPLFLLRKALKRYVREIYPTKSARTQRDNDKELVNLRKVFAQAPIDAIQPMHIREYLDIRGQMAQVRASREKALFSHIFNKARAWATRLHRTLAKGYGASRKPGAPGT